MHYKGIEYKKDDGPWKVYVSDKSDNSSNNQPQVAQQNSLTEDDNDCTMSNLQTQPDKGNSSGWIDPILMLKLMHQIQWQRTQLDSGNPNQNPSACEPSE